MALKGLGLEEMMKGTSTSKALVIRINLIFILFFIVFYISLLLLQPSSLYHDIAGNAAHIGCSFRDCGGHHSKKVIENKDVIRREKPLFLDGPRIGLVNMHPREAAGWGEVVPVKFERVSKNLEWKDLFPEWIDEEEENEGPPTCPEVPMPEMRKYEGEMDVVVARVPCEATRDVFRLQVHLVVARVVVEKGRRSVDGGGGGGGRWRGWEERRAAEREHTRELRAAVWLTEEFPLGVEEVVAVMDVLADEVKAVKRVREVLATKFPPGTFPVKISIPVVPTVRVVITFSKFVDLQSSEQFFTPPSSPRDLPSSPEEEEEHHHHRPGSAASVHPMTLEEEDDPFTIPSDYTWTTLAAEDERLRRSSSRKGECKKKQCRKTCPR